MITNAPFSFKLIDFSENEDINECVEKWYNYLKDCEEDFYNPLLFKNFIERFIIRNYNRFLSTQTTYEFKLLFKDYLMTLKEQANRLNELNKKDLELFFTSYNITENEINNILKSENELIANNENVLTSENKNISESNNRNFGTNNTTTTNDNVKNFTKNTTENNSNNFHSDTPKTMIDVNSLKNNVYVTDFDKNENIITTTNDNTLSGKVKNENEIDITNNTNTTNTNNINSKNKTNQNTKNNTNSTNNQNSNTKNYGYNGNTKELINNYLSFSLDVFNFYLSKVDEFSLFLKILY